MKLKIISIEPDYASFPAISLAFKAHVHAEMKDIVTYQILDVEGTTDPIDGKIYTSSKDANNVLQEIREDAQRKIGQFNYYRLPGQVFDLVPIESLPNKQFSLTDKEFDLGDKQ